MALEGGGDGSQNPYLCHPLVQVQVVLEAVGLALVLALVLALASEAEAAVVPPGRCCCPHPARPVPSNPAWCP